jgi:hypothetical protein
VTSIFLWFGEHPEVFLPSLIGYIFLVRRGAAHLGRILDRRRPDSTAHYDKDWNVVID